MEVWPAQYRYENFGKKKRKIMHLASVVSHANNIRLNALTTWRVALFCMPDKWSSLFWWRWTFGVPLLVDRTIFALPNWLRLHRSKPNNVHSSEYIDSKWVSHRTVYKPCATRSDFPFEWWKWVWDLSFYWWNSKKKYGKMDEMKLPEFLDSSPSICTSPNMQSMGIVRAQHLVRWWLRAWCPRPSNQPPRIAWILFATFFSESPQLPPDSLHKN